MSRETATLDQALTITEALTPADQLRLISILSERLSSEIEVGTEQIDLLTLAGLGADIWEQIDTDAYLDEERNSWES
jgi:hypothetical protein